MEEELELINDDFQDLVEINVDPGQSALRIDKFLTDRLERVSRNRIQQAIVAGAVLVNQNPVKPNYKIRPKDFITVLIPRPPESLRETIPENIPLDIRYEDDDLMIINKPPGMVVHPGVGNHRGTLVNALKFYLGSSEEKVGLVHRIDKDTSGLLVVAKNEASMSHLAKQFFYHTIERTYYALCWGEPNPLKGTITGNIGRHPRFRKQFTVFPEGDQGKEAITHYEVIEPLYFVSLVKCNLETGRTHQIRVHLKYIGHPLFNDERYGGDRIHKGTIFTKYKQFVKNVSEMLPRQALHAASLGFIHPSTGQRMFFEQELPLDFKNALDKWRHYVTHQKNKLENDDSTS